MMGRRMVFGKVVGVVVFAPFPMDAELILLRAATDPVKTHVHALDLRCLTMSLAMPQAVDLSVFIGVAGWGWPMSRRA
jgi:hypothetical protein